MKIYTNVNPDVLKKYNDVMWDIGEDICMMSSEYFGDVARDVIMDMGWDDANQRQMDSFLLERQHLQSEMDWNLGEKLVAMADSAYHDGEISLQKRNADVRRIRKALADFTAFADAHGPVEPWFLIDLD